MLPVDFPSMWGILNEIKPSIVNTNSYNSIFHLELSI